VYEMNEGVIIKATPWLKWGAALTLPGHQKLSLGTFATVDDAARAYDAEVRRRGWVHVKPLNFPQPEELAAYPAQAGERCDERGLPLSLAPEPPVGAQGAGAARGAADHPPPNLKGQKPGKSGFYGVVKYTMNKVTPWRAQMSVPGAKNTYLLGYFATKQEAARAYDVEVRRRGWALIKRLNFSDPVDDAALPPAAAAEAPRSEDRGAG
jgi:hypothetical protein